MGRGGRLISVTPGSPAELLSHAGPAQGALVSFQQSSKPTGFWKTKQDENSPTEGAALLSWGCSIAELDKARQRN